MRTLSFANRQRGGGYGHDAALTGGAAAAAVASIQAARMPWRGPSRDRSSAPYDGESSSSEDSSFARDRRANRPPSGRQQETVERSIGGRETNEHGAAQDPPHIEQTNRDQSLKTKLVQKLGMGKNPDHAQRADTQVYADHGSSHEQLSQTQSAAHSRDVLGAGTTYAGGAMTQDHKDDSRRIHFSDDVEEFDAPSARRYEAPKHLAEFASAGTAILLAEDLDLDSDRNFARSQNNSIQQRRAVSGQSNATLSHEDVYRNDTSESGFQPPLFLKCGPLLRYNGISRDSGSSREIWRGSVMIVTEDARSLYQSAPTLRLFRQPMELVPPPPSQVNGETGQHLASEHIDPLAGQPKISRDGKTLYVRPVHHLPAETDLSRLESDEGLFERVATNEDRQGAEARIHQRDGERMKRYQEVRGFRLHAERGVTFWRFNIQVELGSEQTRVAYRINHGSAIGFWVPAAGQMMNVMFHSCNGFSMSVDSNTFSGPDPMWRDVLNNHQTTPIHCMLGGGDQIYNDAAMRETEHFQAWLATKNPFHKHSASFTPEMQEELERFYLDRYCMWFSQGLFGMANSQIPMVNMWDDHDIIDVSV